MKTRKLKLMALILSASMFLAACGGAGSGSEGSTADKDPLVINENDKSQIAKIQIVARNNVESTEGLLSIESGNSTNLKLWAIYDNNESKEITRDVTWAVESLGIIDLENNGNITKALAKSPGITSITASYNNLTTVESFIVSTPSKCFNTQGHVIIGLNKDCRYETTLVIPPKINGSVITEIGDSVFRNSILQSVSMPLVQTIGNLAFSSTFNLRSVSMPLVKTIMTDAFKVTGLKNISMPSVRMIDKGAFSNNPQLESVSMPLVKTIETQAFYVYDSEHDLKIELKNVSMPQVETIGSAAFANNSRYKNDKNVITSLKNISMPSVRMIGKGAFANNPQLESVSMPKVENIDVNAFYKNDKLKSVTIGDPSLITLNQFYGTLLFKNDMVNYTCVVDSLNNTYYRCETSAEQDATAY